MSNLRTGDPLCKGGLEWDTTGTGGYGGNAFGRPRSDALR